MGSLGYKQQLAAANSQSPAPAAAASGEPWASELSGRGNLVKHLLHILVSAAAVQKLCHMAWIDGLKDAELGKLAAMGSWGAHPGNVTRDLKMHISKICSNPYAQHSVVSCSCWNLRLCKQDRASMAYYDPMGVPLSCKKAPTSFSAHTAASQQGGLLWEAVPDSNPRLQILLQETGRSKASLSDCIGLWVHGDGVEYVDGRSLRVYSFGSVLAEGSLLDTSLLLLAVPKDICTDDTWSDVLEGIVRSFTLLQKPGALHPYSFVIWSIQGDQDFFANSLKLPHWMNPKPCWSCHLGLQECLQVDRAIPLESLRTVQEECDSRLSSHPMCEPF